MTNVVFLHPAGAVSRSCCCCFLFLFNSCVFNTFKCTSIPTVKSGGPGTSHDTNRLEDLFTSFNSSSCSLSMICWITSVSCLSRKQNKNLRLMLVLQFYYIKSSICQLVNIKQINIYKNYLLSCGTNHINHDITI